MFTNCAICSSVGGIGFNEAHVNVLNFISTATMAPANILRVDDQNYPRCLLRIALASAVAVAAMRLYDRKSGCAVLPVWTIRLWLRRSFTTTWRKNATGSMSRIFSSGNVFGTRLRELY
jgi:hypothetical protein